MMKKLLMTFILIQQMLASKRVTKDAGPASNAGLNK
jgi:hypothetical protein